MATVPPHHKGAAMIREERAEELTKAGMANNAARRQWLF